MGRGRLERSNDVSLGGEGVSKKKGDFVKVNGK